MGAISSLSLGVACLQLTAIVTAVKLLLVPTYRSTDFEVHRNWLAITHSLPISKWYVEATSEWTLDYPPLFAWFEWLLSHFARLADPAMLAVHNLEYASTATVLFQRGSVIVTDLVLLAAAYVLARDVASSEGQEQRGGPAGSAGSDATTERPREAGSGSQAQQQQHQHRLARRRFNAGLLLFFLVSCSAGLLLVDHIHFQYNGVLMGVLLWSLHAARTGRHLLSGFLFAVLLNMKHLFLYAAPVYFVYLLRHYCLAAGGACGAPDGGDSADGGGKRPAAAAETASLGRKADAGQHRRRGDVSGSRVAAAAGRLAVLGSCVVAVFALSFGPYVAMGQTQQVLRRLFPFGRGLLHAYWAANAWAPYAAADKLLAAALPRLGPLLSRALGRDVAVTHPWLRVRGSAANMADGRVGISYFAVLPQVTPAATAAAVLAALLPCLVALWAGDRRPQYIRRTIARAVSYSFLCGFVFGYHVHEKAVLVALLPMAIGAVSCRTAARHFLLLSAAGHYGLLPLLFRPQEYGAKTAVVLSYFAAAAAALRSLHADADADATVLECSGTAAANAVGVRQQAVAPRQGTQPHRRRPQLLGPLGRIYVAGFVVLELYCTVVHPYLVPGLAARLPFVPLLATSVYCSLGVLGVWADMAAEWAREAVAGLRWGMGFR